MNSVHRKSGTKVMTMKMDRDELFEPTTQYSINSTPFFIEFEVIIFADVNKEMEDQKKATFWDM